MQFIYGTGIDAFFHRAEVLAGANTAPASRCPRTVKDAVRRFEPRY